MKAEQANFQFVNLVSGLTALSGMPTLTLPTLNLSVIGENLSKNIDVQE